MNFPNISPIAFSVFGFEVKWYALSYIFGFILSGIYIKYILRKSVNNIISYKDFDNLTSYLIVGIIFGGRIGYTLFYNFNYYKNNLFSVFKLWEGGMSFHGGLIGSVISSFIWCKFNKKSFLYIADVVAQAAPIGLFLGRIANFINAELYGRITTLPVGIIFPNTDGIPRHPSQLYEAFGEGILLFLLLLFISNMKKIKRRNGIVLFSFLGLYGLVRVIIENFREPDLQIGYLFCGITMGQLLTVPMIIISIISIIYILKQHENIQQYISSPLLESFNVITRFFTRNGGVSNGVFATANTKFESSDSKNNVLQNRKLLLNTINCNADTSLITVNQQHTNNIIIIDSPVVSTKKFLDIKADGIITNQKGLAIGILTADCIPVLITDIKTGYVAVLHCGWKSIYRDIIKVCIEKMISLGSNIDNLKFALGPCLKQQSYEVDKDFRDNIVLQDISFKSLFKSYKNKFLFDCTKYCIMKINKEGIKINQLTVDILNFDTYRNDDLFFSYRRSLISGEYENNNPLDEGRQLSIIMKI